VKKTCLIILCGLKIGGVETYICRLATALSKIGITPVLLVLSRKSDPSVVALVAGHAEIVWIDEVQAWRGATSWLNAFIPLRGNGLGRHKQFDFVHVCDSLSLHFLALNRARLPHGAATIGLYHEQEFVWWRDQQVLFRQEQIALAAMNADSILFPNEIIREQFAHDHGLDARKLPLLPLGVDMPHGGVRAARTSHKIVSIGRLVDFKTYNRLIISLLPALREWADFTYHIYGTGPMEIALRRQVRELGLDAVVTFHGNVAPESIGDVLEGAFCFVGSGTTIITAASYGIPAFAGIESNQDSTSGGLFSNVVGYSYNEAACYAETRPLLDDILALYECSESGYQDVCRAHIAKSAEFDIGQTVHAFIDSFRAPLAVMPGMRSRWRAAWSVVSSLVPLLGPGIFRFKKRYLKT
jgi:glycosyltransferase involved in cell wall biosynthesis